MNEALSLLCLGSLAELRGDLTEAEGLYRESLAINKEVGERGAEADSLERLASIAGSRYDLNQQRRLYTEVVKIRREIGIPIDEFYTNNGY